MRKFINILILSSISTLVIAQFTPGTIGSYESICYGYAPAPLSFTTPPTGTPTFQYRWQRSNDNGNTWIDISGTTASLATYSPPVLGRTTRFRCRVTDASNNPAATNIVIITVSSNLTAGEIGPSQLIDPGDSPQALIETVVPSGGGGAYNYQWQSSSNGLYWSDIQGANSAGYAPGAMFTDTWFRRFVTDGLCGSTASNSVKIAVPQITMFTTEVPLSYDANPNTYNLGSEFQVTFDGAISKARLYTNALEGGEHIVRLWMNDGSSYKTIAGPYTWNISPGTIGWHEYVFIPAIPVQPGLDYIISITPGSGNYIYAQSATGFIPDTGNDYLTYIQGLYAGDSDAVPHTSYFGATYFRDVVFIPFAPGSIGSSQTICYNTGPSVLTQVTAPTGGSGIFNYQWQSSPDGITWTNIQDATSQDYSPGALTATTYLNRVVSSGGITASCSPVLITVDPQFSLAQLQGTGTVPKNTSANIEINVTGGTPHYTIEYTCNNIPLTPILSSNSIIDISTGVLVTGTYSYALTSVTDALGCVPESLGDNITVTATDAGLSTRTNNALIVVNSTNSANFPDYANYVQPYLDWFGIPYEICDISSMPLPELSDYAIIILGHRNVYESGYPITNIENAINAGTGLYSFDPHLFDYESSFNTPGFSPAVESHQIDINPAHYITQYHISDEYNPTNSTVTLLVINNIPKTFQIDQCNYTLSGGINLATMSEGADTAPLLQVASFGSGRIVKWNSYTWMVDDPPILGPVFGMDDLIWKGIVWAARKPFVIQGIPPMITMRVDDVDGTRSTYMQDLEWLEISNEYGLIPWCGTFINDVSENFYSTLQNLVNNNLATASPHAFSMDDFIFYNYHNDIE
ncbi:MAG: DUF4082 domain-containing protein, partial [ANME-2 cluster archaeon]